MSGGYKTIDEQIAAMRSDWPLFRARKVDRYSAVYTFNDGEIDKFLPPNLKRTANRQS